MRYILLQRPMLQRFNGIARWLRLSAGLKLAVDSAVRSGAIKREFVRMIEEDYASMRPSLPSEAMRILDVGCGVAGIDVLLFRHYRQAPDLEFFLLDQTNSRSDLRYGFSSGAEFYNSLQISKRMLGVNGVNTANVRLIEARESREIPVGNLDLVISIASWGFHYPVSDYLEQVYEALKPGGKLILDVRTGQGQEKALRGRFETLDLIAETWNGKAGRFCAAKGPVD
ncbi:MAG: class I SAM-dependent methyltransferase [Acidobacteriota bacterium]